MDKAVHRQVQKNDSKYYAFGHNYIRVHQAPLLNLYVSIDCPPGLFDYWVVKVSEISVKEYRSHYKKNCEDSPNDDSAVDTNNFSKPRGAPVFCFQFAASLITARKFPHKTLTLYEA